MSDGDCAWTERYCGEDVDTGPWYIRVPLGAWQQDSCAPILKEVRTRALLSPEKGWRGAQGSLAQPVGVSDLFHLSSQLISNWSYPSSLALEGIARLPLLPPFHLLKLSSLLL